jgi:hypothetical protein
LPRVGHPCEPEKLAYIVLAFFARDKIVGFDTTRSLKGDLSIWVGLVILSILASVVSKTSHGSSSVDGGILKR